MSLLKSWITKSTDAGPFHKTLSELDTNGLCIERIPKILRDSIEFLRESKNIRKWKFLKELADTKEVEKMAKRIIQGKPSKYKRVNVAAAILKRFLIELPTVLITDQIYWKVIDSSFSPLTERKKKLLLMQVLHQLPHRSRANLCYLMDFLSKVNLVEENGMNARELAVVFAPIIIRQDGLGPPRRSYIEESINIIEYFIERYDEIMLTLNGFESMESLNSRMYYNVFHDDV